MTSRPLRIALVRGRVVFGHLRFVSPRVRRATLVVVLALSLVGHPEPVAAAQFRTAAMPSLSPDSSGVGRRTAVFASSIALDAPPDSFADPPRPWVRPTTKPVVERFSLPSGQYGAGQRGVVFATGPGDAVASIGEGTVSFVGVVAGTFWISIEHADAFVSSYGPIQTSNVARGETVAAGQAIGTTGGELHVGVRQAGQYIDPESLWGLGAWHAVLDAQYLAR